MYASFQPDPRFQSKSWFNERGGYIFKSTLDPVTGKIIEERLAYNQPNTYTKFLNDYFKTKLR